MATQRWLERQQHRWSEARQRKARKGEQLTLEDARKPEAGRHGGWRPGAGRPARKEGVAHEAREEFAARHPVLVTWRLVEALPSLRQQRYTDIIVPGIAAAHRTTFRITDFSIQTNHLHFLCEADGRDALCEGLQGFASRMVSRINGAMGRRGALFEDRYHDRVLKTPREVKNALRYVLNNARHHGEAIHFYYHPDWIDPFSSARWFDGWRRPLSTQQLVGIEPYLRCAVAAPKTWLREIGWRQWGLLDYHEVPGSMTR